MAPPSHSFSRRSLCPPLFVLILSFFLSFCCEIHSQAFLKNCRPQTVAVFGVHAQV